jgi:Nif-specific regulatory protein
VENERLNQKLERLNERLLRENRYLRQRLVGFDGFEHIIGKSVQLRSALAELARVRLTEATTHIQGETGTGKELVARALHFGGPREKGPFIAQNCAGVAETLIQSTLFGHRRGSFTGADRDHPGVFQAAHKGSLFLDEVAELSPAVQASLLRALQEGEVMPLGASHPVKVYVRFISASHTDLRDEVLRGQFREDLYFRLMVISIRLPALRERLGDIPVLAQHFLDLHCERHRKDIPGFTVAAMAVFEEHRWPGNIRELENEVERLVVLGEVGSKIPPELLSPHLLEATQAAGSAVTPRSDGLVVPSGLTFDDAVVAVERALIEKALRESDGTTSRAATRLGMERSRLGKLRRRLGV